jgi:hypothetical protein
MSEQLEGGYVSPESTEEIKSPYEQIEDFFAEYDQHEMNVAVAQDLLEGLLKKYPDLGNSSELFLRISRDGFLQHLVSYAAPHIRAMLKETIPQSAEDAEKLIYGLLDGKAVNTYRIIKTYLEMYPELSNNYELFARLAADSHYDPLLTYASDEVMKRVDATNPKTS